MDVIHARILEAVNQGEDLIAFFSGLTLNHRKCPHFLGPAVYMLSNCYRAARDAGFAVQQTDPAMVEFMASGRDRMLYELTWSINTNGNLAADQLFAMICSFYACKRAGFTWSFVTQSPTPVAVSIVKMPNLITTTEVKRDPETMEITSTVASQKYATH